MRSGPPFSNTPSDSDSDWLDWFEPYCLNQLHGPERTRFEAWLAETPDRKEAVEQFRAHLTRPTAAPFSVEERDALRDAIISAATADVRRMLAPKTTVLWKAARRDGMRGVRNGMTGLNRFGAWTTRVVATAVALASIVLTVSVAKWRDSSAREAQTFQYATGLGQRSHITLPDGSRVTLAPSSRLQYATNANGARAVTLVGRAYFTIIHDARAPLTIHTGSVRTQVLGTAFDIQRYGDDTAMRIVVVDGKVAVRGRGAPVSLTAGSDATFTDSTANVVTNRDTREADAWTHGRLVFDDIRVDDLLHALHRWYGYEFRVADSTLVQQHVTVMLSVDDTTNAMSALKALLGVTLQFDGNVVTLHTARRSSKPGRDPGRWPREIPSHTEVGK